MHECVYGSQLLCNCCVLLGDKVGIACVNRHRSVCARLCAVVRAEQCVTLLRMAFGGKSTLEHRFTPVKLEHLHEFKPPVHQRAALTTSAPHLFMDVSSAMGTFGPVDF